MGTFDAYKNLNVGQRHRMDRMIKKAHELYAILEKDLNDTQPEKRLALERLMECVMWADNCVVRENLKE